MTKYSKKGKGKEKVRKKTRKGKQIKGGAEIPGYEEPVSGYEEINGNKVTGKVDPPSLPPRSNTNTGSIQDLIKFLTNPVNSPTNFDLINSPTNFDINSMAVTGVRNPNYGLGGDNLGIYGSNQFKDKDSRNFKNNTLLFYFMFHNINKYKLLIVKSKEGKIQKTNLRASKYCLETIYHNPYYEPFYNTRAKYKYTFDNTLNLPDNIFDSLADKYKKSDYVQESSSLLLNYYSDGAVENETKFKVFDENFIRMMYYLYAKKTIFFDFLNFDNKDTLSGIINLYKEKSIDFNLEKLIQFIKENNKKLYDNLHYYFYNDNSPIEHYFKLDKNSDKNDYLDLLAFLSETKTNVTTEDPKIQVNNNIIGFRLNMCKIIRDNNIIVKQDGIYGSSNVKLYERRLLTDEILNFSLDKFNFVDKNNIGKFTLGFNDIQKGETVFESGKLLKIDKNGGIVYDSPEPDIDLLDLITQKDILNNGLTEKIKEKFKLRLQKLKTKKNNAFGVEIFKLFSSLRDISLTQLYDILLVMTDNNVNHIFTAHNFMFLERSLPKIKGIGLINSDYDIYTKNKLGEIQMKTDLDNRELHDFFILDLECEEGTDNCGPMEKDSKKRYFSSKKQTEAESKIENLFKTTGESLAGGRSYLRGRKIHSRPWYALKSSRPLKLRSEKGAIKSRESGDKKLYAREYFKVLKSPFSTGKEKPETGIKFEENIITRNKNGNGNFITFRRYLIPPIFNSEYYNCSESKNDRTKTGENDFGNEKCKFVKLPKVTKTKKNVDQNVPLCVKIANMGIKSEDDDVTSRKKKEFIIPVNKKSRKHRKYENYAFERVTKRDTVLSRCVNPAKFGFPRDVIDRIINYKNKPKDAKYKPFKDIFDKNKLHYSFYKFWGLAKNTGYFEKEGVLGVILSNFDALYSTALNATEIQDDKLRLGDFKPKDTLSTKAWRTLRETVNIGKVAEGNKIEIDKTFMKDAKRYMRILNYFREFSDVYFEKILGLQLKYDSGSRKYFNRTTECSQDNPDVIFFMNKMEEYLVKRNKAFIHLNTRGFKDSKQEAPIASPLPSASVQAPLSSPLARDVDAAMRVDASNPNTGDVEKPQAQAGESASGKPVPAARNKNPTDPINITVSPTNTVTINNESKELDKLMEKLNELLTRREQAVNAVPGSQGPQGPKGETGAQGPQGEQGPPGPAVEVSPDLSALFNAINNSNKDLSNLKSRIGDLEKQGEIAPAPVATSPIPKAPPLPQTSSARTAPSKSENNRIYGLAEQAPQFPLKNLKLKGFQCLSGDTNIRRELEKKSKDDLENLKASLEDKTEIVDKIEAFKQSFNKQDVVFAEGDVDKRYDEKSTLFEQIKACFNKKRSNTEPDRLTNEYDFSTILIGIINSLIKKKENEEREGN